MEFAAVPRGDSAFDKAHGILERVIAPIADCIGSRIAISAFRLGPHHGIGDIRDLDARIRRNAVDRILGRRGRRGRRGRQFGGRSAAAEQRERQNRREYAAPRIPAITKIKDAYTDSPISRMRYVHESSPIAERSRGHRVGCGCSG